VREVVVHLPSRWLRDQDFENLVGAHNYGDLLQCGRSLTFAFGPGTKAAAHTGLCLLSFFNQLACAARGAILLRFPSSDGLFGYLGRNGFLDLLSHDIATEPERPAVSGAVIFGGASANLVEIQELVPGTTGQPRQEIVRSLVDALVRKYPATNRTLRLQQAVFTALGELVDNVFGHSQTAVPGYAVLQAYARSERVQIAVSDSGIGIPRSIREARRGRVGRMSEGDLIIAAFQDGLSRHGDLGGRGCGLPTCARLAAEYNSDVIVRTPAARVTLTPHIATHGLQAVVESCNGFAGTHICLQFRVDRYRGRPL
jgi:anti-sigma regulatory factor (Ser/Thr protein kinase)